MVNYYLSNSVIIKAKDGEAVPEGAQIIPELLRPSISKIMKNKQERELNAKTSQKLSSLMKAANTFQANSAKFVEVVAEDEKRTTQFKRAKAFQELCKKNGFTQSEVAELVSKTAKKAPAKQAEATEEETISMPEMD